jgi:hypothetical protein
MAIEIRGLDRLIKKLGVAGGTQMLAKPMTRSLLRLQRRMQEYPPALPARQGPLGPRASRRRASVRNFRTGYRRTGTYGRRWTWRMAAVGGGLQGRVGNNVAYGPYVGSERFQAKVHRGRWNTDERVMRQEAPGIVADFQSAIDKALGE